MARFWCRVSFSPPMMFMHAARPALLAPSFCAIIFFVRSDGGSASSKPAIAALAFAPAGCEVEQQKTKVWVPAGLCPAGVSARWWSPDGLRVRWPEDLKAVLRELGGPVSGTRALLLERILCHVVGYNRCVSIQHRTSRLPLSHGA